MPFIQKMLQTGTLIEPFSWRRLSTYGGQQFLQSQMLVLGGIFNIGTFDVGLCPLIMAGMVWAMLRPRTTQWRALAAGLACLVLLLPVPRFNTQSQATGLVLFMTLFSTMRMQRWDGRDNWRVSIGLGIIGAALSTLRMNFLPGAVLAIALSALRLMLIRRREWRAPFNKWADRGLSFAVCLGPWAWVLWQSSRSLFYPAMHGLFRPEFSLLDDKLSTIQRLFFIGTFLIFPPLLTNLLPFGLVLHKRFLRDAIPLFAAALVTTMLTAWAFSGNDVVLLYRYPHPLLMGAALSVIAWTLRQGARRRGGRLAVGVTRCYCWPR